MRDCSQQYASSYEPRTGKPREPFCFLTSKIEHRPQIPETGVSRDLGSNVILKGASSDTHMKRSRRIPRIKLCPV